MLAEKILPNSFNKINHYYEKVLQSEIHPTVEVFFNLSIDQIITRYMMKHHHTDKEALVKLLTSNTKHLNWGGGDLIHVTDNNGVSKMILIELNSCPSGLKSMPMIDKKNEKGQYNEMMQKVFLPLLRSKTLPQGALAVIYDKNYIEVTGYAAALADALGEPVYLAPFMQSDKDHPVRFVEGVLEVKDSNHVWHPIRAAFRYVTQQPWNRIPIETKTLIMNPLIACLAGGRNKQLAAKAYEKFNAEWAGTGLQIHTPHTVCHVKKEDVPVLLESYNWQAVIKSPYGNCGQDVFIIRNVKELESYMSQELSSKEFIVQDLIGHSNWNTKKNPRLFHHVGTMPDKNNEIYIGDLRLVVGHTKEGIRPMAMNARKTKSPLTAKMDGGCSKEMLGTNLSVKKGDDLWNSDTDRLIVMSTKEFDVLGLNLDTLIEGLLQTTMAFHAIDEMAERLMSDPKFFQQELWELYTSKPNLQRLAA
jgi:hypothetical protein